MLAHVDYDGRQVDGKWCNTSCFHCRLVLACKLVPLQNGSWFPSTAGVNWDRGETADPGSPCVGHRASALTRGMFASCYDGVATETCVNSRGV